MVGRWRTTRREAGRDRVEVLRYCGTAGEDVLDATSFISGCVRANWVISTRQEFLTIAKSLQLARTVVSVVADIYTRQAWGKRPEERAVT